MLKKKLRSIGPEEVPACNDTEISEKWFIYINIYVITCILRLTLRNGVNIYAIMYYLWNNASTHISIFKIDTVVLESS